MDEITVNYNQSLPNHERYDHIEHGLKPDLNLSNI